MSKHYEKEDTKSSSWGGEYLSTGQTAWPYPTPTTRNLNQTMEASLPFLMSSNIKSLCVCKNRERQKINESVCVCVCVCVYKSV